MLLIILQTTLSRGSVMLAMLAMLTMLCLLKIVDLRASKFLILSTLVVPRQVVVARGPPVGIGGWPRRVELVLHTPVTPIATAPTPITSVMVAPRVTEGVHAAHPASQFLIAAHGASQFTAIVLVVVGLT